MGEENGASRLCEVVPGRGIWHGGALYQGQRPAETSVK